MKEIVWDIPSRLIHWGLALCVILNFFVLEEGEWPHQWSGYLAVFFVCIRIIWGFRGGKYSRFSSFPLKPQDFKIFFRQFRSIDYPGHNPMASLVYLGVWTCVLALGISGFMMSLDAFWGEEWLEETHELISIFLKILVVSHFLGMAADSIKFKRKTWLGMLRGRRH